MKKKCVLVLVLAVATCMSMTSCFKFSSCTCEDAYGNTAVVDPDDYGVDNCSDACWHWQGYGY